MALILHEPLHLHDYGSIFLCWQTSKSGRDLNLDPIAFCCSAVLLFCLLSWRGLWYLFDIWSVSKCLIMICKSAVMFQRPLVRLVDCWSFHWDFDSTSRLSTSDSQQLRYQIPMTTPNFYFYICCSPEITTSQRHFWSEVK